MMNQSAEIKSSPVIHCVSAGMLVLKYFSMWTLIAIIIHAIPNHVD